MSDYHRLRRYDRGDDFQDSIQDTADRLSKNGKNIVSGSSGGGATTNVHGNHLTDVNITINLNLGENVNMEALEKVTDLLKQIQGIKSPESITTHDDEPKEKRKWFG